MQKTSPCEVIGRHPNNFAEHNRRFEFTSLHHPVRQFSDLSENRSKSARVRAIAIMHGPGERLPSIRHTQEEAVEIQALRGKGKSIREIARMRYVSRDRVRPYLRSEGLPRIFLVLPEA
jgi:hypothetical protein